MSDDRVPVHTSGYHGKRPALAQGINGWCIHVDPTTRGVVVAVNNDHLSPISTVLHHSRMVPIERTGLARLLLGQYSDVLDDRIAEAVDDMTDYILRLEGLARTTGEAAVLAAAEAASYRVIHAITPERPA